MGFAVVVALAPLPVRGSRSRASTPVVVRLALFLCPLAPGAVAVF